MIGTIITPAGTRTYVVEELPALPELAAIHTIPITAGGRPRAPHPVRGALLTLGATVVLLALLGLGWIGSAVVLRPTRASVRAVRPTAALLALGPAELLGAAPVLDVSSPGAPQP